MDKDTIITQIAVIAAPIMIDGPWIGLFYFSLLPLPGFSFMTYSFPSIENVNL